MISAVENTSSSIPVDELRFQVRTWVETHPAGTRDHRMARSRGRIDRSCRPARQPCVTESSRLHDVVMLHWFGGMTHAEVAEELDVSTSTAEKDFRYALGVVKPTLWNKPTGNLKTELIRRRGLIRGHRFSRQGKFHSRRCRPSPNERARGPSVTKLAGNNPAILKQRSQHAPPLPQAAKTSSRARPQRNAMVATRTPRCSSASSAQHAEDIEWQATVFDRPL